MILNLNRINIQDNQKSIQDLKNCIPLRNSCKCLNAFKKNDVKICLNF